MTVAPVDRRATTAGYFHGQYEELGPYDDLGITRPGRPLQAPFCAHVDASWFQPDLRKGNIRYSCKECGKGNYLK